MTTVSCLIASHGDDTWKTLARDRAAPSTHGQPFHEVLHLHGIDLTLAQTRNSLADMATGDWIVFLDADDQLAPSFAATIAAVIGDHAGDPFGLYGFTPAVAYTTFRRNSRLPTGKIWPRQDLKDGNWMVIGTVVPRRAFLEVGGFKEWPMYEDWCLWQRLDQLGVEWIEVPDAVYLAYQTPNSRNRKPNREARLAAHDMIRRANYPEEYP